MWTWLISPLGRKVALGVGLVLALFVALKWYEAKIRADEQAKQADKQSQEIEKMRQADRAATERILNEAQAKLEAAETRAQLSREREAGLIRTIQSIGQRSAAAVVETSKLSDSERRAYIISRLHLRADNDNTPCYTPREEAAITEAITQYPLCVEKNTAQSAQIQEVKEQVSALTEKTVALETKFDSLAGYTDRLEGYYRVVWEAIPRKGRKAWPPNCWIFKCSKKVNLPVPAPLDLKKAP